MVSWLPQSICAGLEMAIRKRQYINDNNNWQTKNVRYKPVK